MKCEKTRKKDGDTQKCFLFFGSLSSAVSAERDDRKRDKQEKEMNGAKPVLDRDWTQSLNSTTEAALCLALSIAF